MWDLVLLNSPPIWVSLQRAHVSGGDVRPCCSRSYFIPHWKRQARVISKQCCTLPKPLKLDVTKEYCCSATVTCTCVGEGNFLNAILFFSVLCQVVHFSICLFCRPTHLDHRCLYTHRNCDSGSDHLFADSKVPTPLALCLPLNSFPPRAMPLICPYREPFISLPYIPGWLPSAWTL